ncbi:leucine-rich repeat, immunoglobulin-like domain and transmembrane domain-containing protein 2 [Ceratina calcarata]|uniref:Leucine-rich repeat, immunoglobulin-like domain and transmembrane domain-containing protein 2 n=1 Tax=Ceratina calcarata TaxID=156304 RepID=A0AAJ7IYV8_9HYME|nr:leucine-rich repeat, immunoglobulin-like domain and transmembrane domain-containing protein 2 [Ceratina calcarata]
MDRLLNAFFIFNLLASAVAGPINCQTITNQRDKSVTFFCTELMNLLELGRAYTNSTSIEISDSKIAHISGHSFARFGATLVTLDLHGSGIETIDSFAFVGLTKLENLLLWGNKLKYVYRDWFVNMYNLKTLDLSFNSIEVIDYGVFQLLPNLRNFYFDYNQIRFIDYGMFAYLQNLKSVKFEKNPLSWGFRAHLIWQLENQHVKYSEDWEDWGWMNVVIKECSESGYGEIPKDTMLDCVVEKLLDYAFEIFSTNTIQQNVDCAMKARELVRCMRPTNTTSNTDNETARRVLEDYTAVLPTMSRSIARFSVS